MDEAITWDSARSGRGTQYEHVLRFFDRVIKESAERGLDRPSNRLEAQSVVWGIERDTPKDDAPNPKATRAKRLLVSPARPAGACR